MSAIMKTNIHLYLKTLDGHAALKLALFVYCARARPAHISRLPYRAI